MYFPNAKPNVVTAISSTGLYQVAVLYNIDNTTTIWMFCISTATASITKYIPADLGMATSLVLSDSGQYQIVLFSKGSVYYSSDYGITLTLLSNVPTGYVCLRYLVITFQLQHQPVFIIHPTLVYRLHLGYLCCLHIHLQMPFVLVIYAVRPLVSTNTHPTNTYIVEIIMEFICLVITARRGQVCVIMIIGLLVVFVFWSNRNCWFTR